MSVQTLTSRHFDFFAVDSTLQIKTIFDNIRNYLICAMVFGVAKWAHDAKYGIHKIPDTYLASFVRGMNGEVILQIVGITLFILNFVQTLILAGRLFSFGVELWDALTEPTHAKAPPDVKIQKVWVSVIATFVGLITIVPFVMVVIFVPLAFLFAFPLSFAWFFYSGILEKSP